MQAATIQAATTLADKITNLPANDQNFAASLLAAFKKGKCSDKQAYWIAKLAERATNGNTPPASYGDDGELSPIADMLKSAGQKMKRPRITLDHDGASIALSLAGASSRYPGSVHITTGQGEDRAYLGRIGTDGKLHDSPARKAECDFGSLFTYLMEFANDPASAAAAHGHATGACCFCNTPIKSEKSLSVGYGPICAAQYGLPWGDAAPSF